MKLYQNWRKYDVKRTHHKETFHLCGAGESRQMVVQFQIGSKRHNAPGTGFFGKHAGDYHYVHSLAPESVFANSFSCTNFLLEYRRIPLFLRSLGISRFGIRVKVHHRSSDWHLALLGR